MTLPSLCCFFSRANTKGYFVIKFYCDHYEEKLAKKSCFIFLQSGEGKGGEKIFTICCGTNTNFNFISAYAVITILDMRNSIASFFILRFWHLCPSQPLTPKTIHKTSSVHGFPRGRLHFQKFQNRPITTNKV